MLKRLKIIIVLVTLSITLCIMSNTYSRYVAKTDSNVNVSLAQWQMLVNSVDITNQEQSDISIKPIILANANVKEDCLAPSSEGYFDILINPTNVDVSFKYTINLAIDNIDTPDLIVTNYSILDSTYVEGDAVEVTTVNENIITNDMLYDNETENFSFNPFTIRVYFKWYEGENELMDNDLDTSIGKLAAEEDKTFNINATILFEQII